MVLGFFIYFSQALLIHWEDFLKHKSAMSRLSPNPQKYSDSSGKVRSLEELGLFMNVSCVTPPRSTEKGGEMSPVPEQSEWKSTGELMPRSPEKEGTEGRVR